MIGRKNLFTVALIIMPVFGSAGVGPSPQVKRGHYLVELAGCSHCHTPGHFRCAEDATRELAGGDPPGLRNTMAEKRCTADATSRAVAYVGVARR